MKRSRDEEDLLQENDKKKSPRLENEELAQVQENEELSKESDDNEVDEADEDDYDSEEDEDFNEDSEDDDDEDDDDDSDEEMAELVEENEAFFQECANNRKSEGEINVMLGLDVEGTDREKELAEEFLRKQRQDEEDDSNDDEDYLDDEDDDEDDEDDKNEEDYIDYKAIDVEDYVSEEDEDFDSDEEQNNGEDDDEEEDQYGEKGESFLPPETEEDRRKEVLETIANIKITFASAYNQKYGHFPHGKQLDAEWMDEMQAIFNLEDKEIISRAIRSIIRELQKTGRKKSFHWEEDLVEKLGFNPGSR
jgi:hypothetical protein